ncbi:PilZ domain-containing protein [Teredinibacter turnerae]|uniref:Cyclic diguanosine monophosphate-binding protein n=1 Tax=Teredinibacter turnerae (strain ATCC 39867 / T7901) TaxID=377629 RepID=C5BS95_TERTT|nr:PilZ domain-containing protein [Teredinibacter turnerae]ACR14470.1 Type IV pilus assembly protein PilZ [Teredinibacter turnerae T7901]
MSEAEERRRFTRVDYQTNATLIQGNAKCVAAIADISLNGLLVSTPEHYEIRVDEPLEVVIELSEDAQIHMKVSLAHSSSELLGFRCESIDVESVAHLRRLLELNLGQNDAAERVLAELLHIS